MSAEMIERVARAICDTSHCDGSVWDDAAEGFRELFRDEARAAIAAMREPTDEVIAAGYDAEPLPYRLYPGRYKHVWRVMIDEALR